MRNYPQSVLVSSLLLCILLFVPAESAVCSTGYYYNSSYYGCVACGSACYTCSSSIVCDTCWNSKCISCYGSTCAACSSGYYASGSSCYSCSSNCLGCLSSSTCLVCNVSYYLTSSGSCSYNSSSSYSSSDSSYYYYSSSAYTSLIIGLSTSTGVCGLVAIGLSIALCVRCSRNNDIPPPRPNPVPQNSFHGMNPQSNTMPALAYYPNPSPQKPMEMNTMPVVYYPSPQRPVEVTLPPLIVPNN